MSSEHIANSWQKKKGFPLWHLSATWARRVSRSDVKKSLKTPTEVLDGYNYWMLNWIAKVDLPCFPSFNFQFTRSHEHCSPLDGMRGLQWPDCTLSSIREVDSKEPIGDPVDSDPTSCHSTNFWVPPHDIEPTVLSCKGFASLYKMLTVFTHLACSGDTNLPLGVDCHPPTT